MKKVVTAISCLFFSFFSNAQIPDSDGDGISDSQDVCPSLPGTKANKGCPEENKQIQTTVQLHNLIMLANDAVKKNGASPFNSLKATTVGKVFFTLGAAKQCIYAVEKAYSTAVNNSGDEIAIQMEEAGDKLLAGLSGNPCSSLNRNLTAGYKILDNDDKNFRAQYENINITRVIIEGPGEKFAAIIFLRPNLEINKQAAEKEKPKVEFTQEDFWSGFNFSGDTTTHPAKAKMANVKEEKTSSPPQTGIEKLNSLKSNIDILQNNTTPEKAEAQKIKSLYEADFSFLLDSVNSMKPLMNALYYDLKRFNFNAGHAPPAGKNYTIVVDWQRVNDGGEKSIRFSGAEKRMGTYPFYGQPGRSLEWGDKIKKAIAELGKPLEQHLYKYDGYKFEDLVYKDFVLEFENAKLIAVKIFGPMTKFELALEEVELNAIPKKPTTQADVNAMQAEYDKVHSEVESKISSLVALYPSIQEIRSTALSKYGFGQAKVDEFEKIKKEATRLIDDFISSYSSLMPDTMRKHLLDDKRQISNY